MKEYSHTRVRATVRASGLSKIEISDTKVEDRERISVDRRNLFQIDSGGFSNICGLPHRGRAWRRVGEEGTGRRLPYREFDYFRVISRRFQIAARPLVLSREDHRRTRHKTAQHSASSGDPSLAM